MAISATDALLGEIVDGFVDYRGRPVARSSTGGWKSAFFIIGVEIAERFAYYGIEPNLISYLTGPLRQSTAAAAANVNAWSGTAYILPLLGAFVADSCLGRYCTILLASLIYILGLGLLTLSAMLPSLRPSFCERGITSCSPPTKFQMLFFFFSLYLVALAQGWHRPCVQAFGADQFDPRDPKENKSKSSFFNWWYFAVCFGTSTSLWIVTYIQENLSWGLGFGVPCMSIGVALFVFLLGTKIYRYKLREEKDPLVRILQGFMALARNRTAKTSADTSYPSLAEDEEGKTPFPHHTNQFKFPDRAAAAAPQGNAEFSMNDWRVCSVTQVEEAKGVLQLFPIGATCLMYAVVLAQSKTFYTKQGSTMERGIGSGFQIPAGTLQALISLTIVVMIPIYDCLFVPFIRSFTGLPSGITMLQRIGIGICLSAVSMVVAAVVEVQRLAVARDAGLIDVPSASVPMSIWWLAPQYILFGVADVFTLVGLHEFFYDQVPDGLRSIGLSLCLCIFGIGSFLSSLLISVIESATSRPGKIGWFSNNLNRAHLDYFYWLLAGLSAIELALYVYFSKSYIYKNMRRSTPTATN